MATKSKESALKVRERSLEALPEMLEDFILSAHASENPDDKRKAVDTLAKLSGEFRDDDKGQALVNITWNVGLNNAIAASVAAAQVIEMEAAPAPETEPQALPAPAEPITFALDFDAITKAASAATSP